VPESVPVSIFFITAETRWRSDSRLHKKTETYTLSSHIERLLSSDKLI
jgi:hypothetical protein